MIKDLETTFAHNVTGRKRSAIRELLKLTQRPDIISFAGGLPATESFPVEDLKEVIHEVMENEAAMVLQYGTTEGDPLLRKLILEHSKEYGVETNEENLLVTSASQQGLDLVGKVLINRGDTVVVGLPTYLGGLGAFLGHGAKLVGVPLDGDGMIPEKLEETLEKLKQEGTKPKFLYIIPDFQNPAGVTIPNARRRVILELARKYDILILEDSPYRELRFEGEHQDTFYSMDGTGHVILLGTFSKIFVPGFRIGWVLAHKHIIEKMIIMKQGIDVCSSPFNQRIAARFIEKGYLGKSIKKIICLYREKRDIMLDAFEKYMPEGVTWTTPQGGLFLFLHLPEHLDAEMLLAKAIEKKVAYVAGTHFFCDGSGKHTARINFSYASKEDNVEGVKRLAELFKKEIENTK